jgi:hypothetical protein
MKGWSKKDSNIPKLLTEKQAGRYLKMSDQSINNLKNSGKIEFQTVSGRTRFSYKNLNDYFVQNITNYALCNEINIWLDIKKQKIIVFDAGNLYRIVNENQRWIYLFSIKWSYIGQFSNNEFKKYFSIAEESQIDAAKYNIGPEIL